MLIDRLEVYNNTIIKNTAHITHTPHIYSHNKMYQCLNLISVYIFKGKIYSLCQNRPFIFIVNNVTNISLKGNAAYFKKNYIIFYYIILLWMKTIHYPNILSPTWSQTHQWRRLLQNQLQS